MNQYIIVANQNNQQIPIQFIYMVYRLPMLGNLTNCTKYNTKKEAEKDLQQIKILHRLSNVFGYKISKQVILNGNTIEIADFDLVDDFEIKEIFIDYK